MTILRNFKSVANHSKIKLLRYFRLRSTALARNTTTAKTGQRKT